LSGDTEDRITEDRISEVRIEQGVAIHGGVGTLRRDEMTPSLEAEYREALTRSLQAGNEALRSGGTAVDAACAAVRVMEDSPLFNAGRGSNFDERGVVSMDASIMDGDTLDAGAVADVTDVRYPVDLARLVMERSEHLMLTGPGAAAFARASGVEATEASFFHTERRWSDLQRAKESGGARPNVIGSAGPTGRAGTVGAVARDHAGRLAAATSTGGMANKTWGRVGDSPIIGAGTYASRLCAVSCTGWGEYFIRHAIAHDVHARMAHGGVSLARAVHGVIWDTLEAQVPGAGGLVAIDRDGNVELCFNTPGMYRGWIDSGGAHHVAVYREG
jgi:beta-aspartyl-peptidase (threonine type)